MFYCRAVTIAVRDVQEIVDMTQALIRHTTETGSLHLDLDTQWKDTDVEIVVQPIDSATPERTELAKVRPSQPSLAERAQAWQTKIRAKYGTLPDSTPLIRADRDQRG